MYNFDQSILRNKDCLGAEANVRPDFLESEDTCLQDGHKLALLKILFLFSPYLYLISERQFGVFIKRVNLIGA